jgi:putative endonuclease
LKNVTSVESPHLLGQHGESLACDYLKRKGYKIIDRNFQTYVGEIDIVAAKKKELHFVEVKTRSGRSFGNPEESVTDWKQDKIKRTAECFLSGFKALRFKKHDICLDVISINFSLGEIQYFLRHLVNAFE